MLLLLLWPGLLQTEAMSLKPKVNALVRLDFALQGRLDFGLEPRIIKYRLNLWQISYYGMVQVYVKK